MVTNILNVETEGRLSDRQQITQQNSPYFQIPVTRPVFVRLDSTAQLTENKLTIKQGIPAYVGTWLDNEISISD